MQQSKKITKMLEKAIAFHQGGYLEQAETAYKTVLKKAPKNPDAHHLLGLVYHQLGKNKSAIASIEKAISLNKNIPDFYNSCGEAYRAYGSVSEAIVYYEKALRLNPSYADAYYNLGLTLQNNRKPKDAISNFEKALKLKPNDVEIHNSLGNASLEIGQYDTAKVNYKKALTLKPNFIEAHNNLGVLLHKLEQYEDAIASFEHALSLNPAYAEAHNNIGLVYQETKQFQKAIKSFNKATEFNQNYYEAYNNSGNILQLLGKHEDAIKFYKKSIAINADYEVAHYNLGGAYREVGRIKDAIDSYKKAVSLNPNYIEAHNNLGVVLHESHQKEEAIICFENALKLDSNYIEALTNLGEVFETSNDLKNAKLYIDKALTLNSNHINAIRLKAILLRREEKYEEALELLIPASESDVNNLEILLQIHFEIGKLYDLINKSDLAIANFIKGNQIQSQRPTSKSHCKIKYIQNIEKISHQFKPEWIKSWTKIHNDEKRPPVFLVGFPRSGTTLLDQILDSHSKIQVIEEKPIIENIFYDLVNSSDRDISSIAQMNNEELSSLRNKYYSHAGKYIDIDKSNIIVDKYPLNIIYIGLINRIFPNSKIILAMRHPYDVCLSCFMQKFVINSAMANFFTLEDTSNLYGLVMDLWEKYESILPLNYHEIKYESLVSDLEAHTKDLIDFLNIEWEPEILDYMSHAVSKEKINTPSYSQVVKPIYQDSVYRWSRYESFLKPYMEKLERHVNYFGY